MHSASDLPWGVRVIENTFIPMPDGVRLAARIWLPEGSERTPVPAILEYIPYRKRDLSRRRDDINHRYMAAHGYACVRLDMRGSGDSEGVLTDEYTEQEQMDAVHAIAWLARQPWCDGNVGMMGISWGGFNSLQVAARQPPELKAIITCCSSDDQYADNMHYMGGCLLGDNLSEATVMFAFNSLPPDPAIVGERWRDLWRQRLEGSGLWVEKWLSHQRRDDYWRRGSVCEDYGAIRCPVFTVGGWADGFTNAVMRLLANLEVPRKGLIGPWGHKYPHLGIPGPAIGFLKEAVRWWDHWLKGQDTGVMDEPMLRVWMQDSVSPNTAYQERPGRWVGENEWPSPRIEQRRYAFDLHGMLNPDVAAAGTEVRRVQSPLSVGMFAGKWCSYAATPDLPGDQREEDGGSLVFHTEPLQQKLEICGMPVVELDLSADKRQAMVAVRLSDVAPSGAATRVTYGLLNLTHRDGDAHPEPLEPGRCYRVKVVLNGIAHSFPAGHRIRVAISTSYWPLAWTSPELAMVKINTGSSFLVLPVRPPREEDVYLRQFGRPEGAPAPAIRQLEPGSHNWRVIRDLAENTSMLEVTNDNGLVHIEETGTDVCKKTLEFYSIREDDVLSARGETHTERCLRRPGWDVRVTTRTVLTCSARHFHIHAQLDAFEGEERVYSANWVRNVPRDMI